MKKNTFESKILAADVAVSAAKDNPEIKTAVAEYNYDDPRLDVGLALQKEADTLHKKQIKEYGDQFQATNDLDSIKGKANKMYMRHLKVARITMEDNVALIKSLMLNGRRRHTYTGWLEQASVFYDNGLDSPEALTALLEYNITEDKMKAGQALVNQTAVALKKQFKELGEAQRATKQRDKAFDLMEDWMAKFIAIARIALEDDPQLLEIMGIIEPS